MEDGFQERIQRWSYRNGRTQALTRFGARSLVYIMYAGVAGMVARRRTTISAANLVRPVATGLLAKLIATALHATVIRPRPFVVTDVPPLIHVEPDNGFPSDHALQVVTLLTAVVALEPSAAPAYGLGGTLTLLARLGAGMHHTGDVVGGAGLTAGSAVLVYRLPLPAAWHAPLAEAVQVWRSRRGLPAAPGTAATRIRVRHAIPARLPDLVPDSPGSPGSPPGR